MLIVNEKLERQRVWLFKHWNYGVHQISCIFKRFKFCQFLLFIKMHSHFIILLIGYVANVLAVYDEKLAREKLLPLSSAAYSSKPEDCIQNMFPDGVVSSWITSPFIKSYSYRKELLWNVELE
jgi:hypothetical protein